MSQFVMHFFLMNGGIRFGRGLADNVVPQHSTTRGDFFVYSLDSTIAGPNRFDTQAFTEVLV